MTRGCAENSVGRGTERRYAAIRWKIGPAAARSSFGVEADALEMLLREDDTGRWSGLVLVRHNAASTTLAERTIDVAWHPDPDLGLLHIDAPGFVCATIDTGNGVPVLLYARSGLLNELGLEGGRYEPDSTDLTPHLPESA